MTTATKTDRNHESIINDTIVRILRERCGLSAVAETLHDGGRPDIIVRLSECPVVVETEFEPALTVEADALSRLGMEIDGQIVQNVFAVTVPRRLRSTNQQYLYDRLAGMTIEWQEWRSDGTSGPKVSGVVIDLGNMLRRVELPVGGVDEAVDALDEGVRRAGSQLHSSLGTMGRVAKVFGTEPDNEVANMAALVITNAMIFQDRLATNEVAFQPVSKAMRNGRFSRMRLLQMWEHILEIDYFPIFNMARDVVQELTEVEATTVLGECARTAAALLGMGSIGRHDLAGRIFNRLISERKLLAAFYTRIPASTLLAGLALSKNRWTHIDWNDAEELSRLSVIDPACGTGTLLMAAYRQIVQNHSTATPADSERSFLHQSLVERVLIGVDVVQAAIHLTAATLAAMSPTVKFEQMQLHTFYLGRNLSGKFCLGSLEWLEAPETQSFLSTTLEQVGALGVTGGLIERPLADLVICNPPFTRRGSDGGKEEAISRLFSIPEGDEESKEEMKRRTSALLAGTPANQIAGAASSFTVLADRLVKPGGRVAIVLPVTALSGGSWNETRRMLSKKFEIEYVVSSHDPSLLSMSYDTAISESLLIARKLTLDEASKERGIFVNLWRAPIQETDALALVSAINGAALTPMHQSDGPPVGGSPIFVGGKQWGEVLDGPIGENSWTAARWKQGSICQFASAIERGELWTEDGSRVVGHVPVAPLKAICNVGPQHRQIKGSSGVFDAYDGLNEGSQYHAIWSLDSSIHRGMNAEPNAWLVPKPHCDHTPIWSQSGILQISVDVRYNSQPVMAVCTDRRTLGVSSWHTLSLPGIDHLIISRMEIALALWCNSTLGIILHAHHSTRSQEGRGRGNKGMLENLVAIDVQKLETWQLDEAQAIWRDFADRKFQPFHNCAVDPTRIQLDERIVRDMLGLDEGAMNAVSKLRELLAVDPSICGSKQPVLPS